MFRAAAQLISRLKPAYVTVGAGALSFALENETVRRFQNEAENIFESGEANERLPVHLHDTPETQQDYVLGHVDPMPAHSSQHRFRILPDMMMHSDFSHSVLQSLSPFGVRTTQFYPRELFRHHWVDYMNPHNPDNDVDSVEAQLEDEAPHLRYVLDDSDANRSAIERFINRHEGTHAGEYHPVGLMTAHGVVTGVQAGVLSTSLRFIARVGLITIPGRIALLGTAALSFFNRRYSLEETENAGTELVVDSDSPTVVNQLAVNAVTRVLERRADQGAIRQTLAAENPRNARRTLEAAEFFLRTEVDESEEVYDDEHPLAQIGFFGVPQHHARTHPHPFERIHMVRQAIEQLDDDEQDEEQSPANPSNG